MQKLLSNFNTCFFDVGTTFAIGSRLLIAAIIGLSLFFSTQNVEANIATNNNCICPLQKPDPPVPGPKAPLLVNKIYHDQVEVPCKVRGKPGDIDFDCGKCIVSERLVKWMLVTDPLGNYDYDRIEDYMLPDRVKDCEEK